MRREAHSLSAVFALVSWTDTFAFRPLGLSSEVRSQSDAPGSAKEHIDLHVQSDRTSLLTYGQVEPNGGQKDRGESDDAAEQNRSLPHHVRHVPCPGLEQKQICMKESFACMTCSLWPICIKFT